MTITESPLTESPLTESPLTESPHTGGPHPPPIDETARARENLIHSRRWAILAVLCLSVFVTVVDGTIVNVALPSLASLVVAFVAAFGALFAWKFLPARAAELDPEDHVRELEPIR